MADKSDLNTMLFLDDFTPGRRFGSGILEVQADAVRRFNSEFGPQPAFVTGGNGAGELAVSGWLVASLTMRLLVDSDLRPAGGIVGGGIEDLRWPAAARPGDTLRLQSEVLEARPSRSRPEQGVAKVRTETLNQHGDTVQVLVSNLIIPRRRDQPVQDACSPTA